MTLPTPEAKPQIWRPIAEIHEDFGPCVLINFRDCGYQQIGSNVDSDFDAKRWTHFAKLPLLTTEQVTEWEEAHPWLCNDCGKPISWPQDLCRSCDDDQERERSRGPQTLADVGMCESDFR